VVQPYDTTYYSQTEVINTKKMRIGCEADKR